MLTHSHVSLTRIASLLIRLLGVNNLYKRVKIKGFKIKIKAAARKYGNFVDVHNRQSTNSLRKTIG